MAISHSSAKRVPQLDAICVLTLRCGDDGSGVVRRLYLADLLNMTRNTEEVQSVVDRRRSPADYLSG